MKKRNWRVVDFVGLEVQIKRVRAFETEEAAKAAVERWNKEAELPGEWAYYGRVE